MIYDVERGVIWLSEDESGQPVGEVIDLGRYNLFRRGETSPRITN
jgi:hypothetical protein